MYKLNSNKESLPPAPTSAAEKGDDYAQTPPSPPPSPPPQSPPEEGVRKRAKTGFIEILDNASKSLSIDTETFHKLDDRIPANKDSDRKFTTITATKTIDSVHDELGKENNKSKPINWEDKCVEYTKIDGSGILDVLDIYGSCVVVEANSVSGGEIPYGIPDNNACCYIKDCFPGQCIPGINNLLDQSTATLRTFLEKNFTTGTNPLGGGKPLYAQDASFPHTAYFNFDVMLFKYITDKYTPSEKINTIKIKLDAGNPIDASEILIINRVNLNYLWAWLMIFCKKSIDSDEYLDSNSKTQYRWAINRLAYIHFSGFAQYDTGHVSNPFFHYYKTTTDEISTYIDTTMGDDIYKHNGISERHVELCEKMAGGVQYVTSQSMAATCITTIMGKMKSVVCRNSDVKDVAKNACQRELTRLFSVESSTGTIPKTISNDKKEMMSCAWSILKYSGDSAHVVFGEIMEHVIDEGGYKIQTQYLVSERPLAARLLSQKKSVMVLGTKVFMENFKGYGSENKNDPHAALKIIFNFQIVKEQLVKGINDKISKVQNNKDDGALTAAKELAKDALDGIVNGMTDTDESIVDDIKESDAINDFLKVYEIYNINNQFNDVIEKIGLHDMAVFKSQFIGRTFRLGKSSNWNTLIEALTNEYRTNNKSPDAMTDKQSKLVEQFRDFQLCVQLLASLGSDVSDKNKTAFNDLNKREDPGHFNVIFTKITHSFLKDDKYNRFEEDRIANWSNSQKGGMGGKIPNAIQLIIQELQQFIDNCLAVNKLVVNTQVGGVSVEMPDAAEPAEDDAMPEGEEAGKDVHESTEIMEEINNSILSMIPPDVSPHSDMPPTPPQPDVKEIFDIDDEILELLKPYTASSNPPESVFANRLMFLSGILLGDNEQEIEDKQTIKNHMEFLVNVYKKLGFGYDISIKSIISEFDVGVYSATSSKGKLLYGCSKFRTDNATIPDTGNIYDGMLGEIKAFSGTFDKALATILAKAKLLDDNSITTLWKLIQLIQKYNYYVSKHNLLDTVPEVNKSRTDGTKLQGLVNAMSTTKGGYRVYTHKHKQRRTHKRTCKQSQGRTRRRNTQRRTKTRHRKKMKHRRKTQRRTKTRRKKYR